MGKVAASKTMWLTGFPETKSTGTVFKNSSIESSTKYAIIDSSLPPEFFRFFRWNSGYTFEPNEALPVWFLEDEDKYNKPLGQRRMWIAMVHPAFQPT
jgi:hypothetical protein